jgi:DNA-binding response OmpR family regulator
VPASTVLVVAPDLVLRRSLEFALEAEGYAVTAIPSIDAAAELGMGGFHCTVLDHAAATGPLEHVIRFCADAKPVVLLSNAPFPSLDGWTAGVVLKPMLGGSLSNTIRRALEQAAERVPPK